MKPYKAIFAVLVLTAIVVALLLPGLGWIRSLFR